jgi:very-short-patch-repair endonuclease
MIFLTSIINRRNGATAQRLFHGLTPTPLPGGEGLRTSVESSPFSLREKGVRGMRPKETLSIVIMVHFGKGRFKDMYISAKPELFRLANHMRHEPTEAEQTLWNELRKFRSKGYVFRRQHPIDFYIADFYCHKVKLVIEVDGGIHSKVQNIEYDDNRSGEFERYGIRVIRFKNAQI